MADNVSRRDFVKTTGAAATAAAAWMSSRRCMVPPAHQCSGRASRPISAPSACAGVRPAAAQSAEQVADEVVDRLRREAAAGTARQRERR